jgi:hypothetical protein
MRSVTVVPRLVAGLVVVLAAPGVLSAQQQAAPPVVSDAAKAQVDAFEGFLRIAIDSAAGKLNNRVREALPNTPIRLEYQTPPIVTGVLLSEAGAVFHVLVPAIADVDLKMTSALLDRERMRREANPVVRANTNPNRVTTGGVVADDPTNVAPLLLEPDKEYTSLVKAALIDAVVDHSLSLPIPPGQYLTVIADELQTQPAGPFNPRSRTLILQLKGEDVIAFRENRISRDDARARVKESRYPN